MIIEKLNQLLPWLLGSGVAAGTTLLSTNCSIPAIGKCGGCGSCAVPLAAIVGLALLKRKEGIQ